MSSSRRRILRSCGAAFAVGVAGCLSAGYAGDGYSPPVPTDCPDEPRVPEPEPHPDGADIPPVPDPPGSLDGEVVREYVGAYELAYAWRKATTWFDAPIVTVFIEAVPSVRESRDGAVTVDLDAVPSGRVDFGNDGGPGHFDGAPYTASYLVTVEAVWRARTEFNGNAPDADPAEEGDLLECY